MANRSNPSADEIRTVLERFRGKRHAYSAPDIPVKKLATAIARTGVPPNAQIQLIIDFTLFGSCRNGMVFTTEGFYYRNTDSAYGKQFNASYRDLPPLSKVYSKPNGMIKVEGGLAYPVDYFYAAEIIEALQDLQALWTRGS